MILIVREFKEKSDNNKSKNTENELSRLVSQLSATNDKIMSIMLSIVQAHLRLPSMMKFPLKHLRLIGLFF